MTVIDDVAVAGPPAVEAPTRPAVAEKRFRQDIEGLRAVAVLMVVLAHAGLTFTGGYVGVDVFFVISGFLITGQLASELERRGRVDFTRFYARRFRRILPAATVVVLATLAATWAWVSPLRISALTRDGIWAALSGMNWRLAAQGTNYLQSTAAPSPFQHYWSLSVEEQFYLVWPLLLVLSSVLLGRRLGRQRAIVGTLLVVIAGSFYLSVTLTATSAPWAYFGSHSRAWALALGALVALTARSWSRLPRLLASIGTWSGLAIVLWTALRFTNDTRYPGYLAAVPVLGAALVIGCGATAPAWSADALLRLWPLQLLGRVSFSWYLWHWPALLILPLALDRDPKALETRLLAIGLSLGLAVATYYLVELPFRRGEGLVRYPQRAFIVGGALITTSVAVAVVVAKVVVIPGGPIGPPLVPAALSPAAVVEASKAKALPANLTPSLESALRDQADSRNCFVDYFGTKPNTSPDCIFGDVKGTKTLVLFGDSHAAQWAGPVFEWGTRNHWKVWFMAKSSCQAGVYPNYIVPALHRVYTECNQYRTAAFDFIRSIKPNLVVIGSLSKGVTITPDGMTETARTLRADGAKVLFIADNPYMGIDPPSCLALHPDNVQRCSVPREGAGLTAAARLAEIDGARAGGAEVWDPTPYICAAVCPSVIGNIGVYKDESHLTNTFTTSLLPQLGDALAQTGSG